MGRSGCGCDINTVNLHSSFRLYPTNRSYLPFLELRNATEPCVSDAVNCEFLNLIICELVIWYVGHLV